jgi:hypothetical protein
MASFLFFNGLILGDYNLYRQHIIKAHLETVEKNVGATISRPRLAKPFYNIDLSLKKFKNICNKCNSRFRTVPFCPKTKEGLSLESLLLFHLRFRNKRCNISKEYCCCNSAGCCGCATCKSSNKTCFLNFLDCTFCK